MTEETIKQNAEAYAKERCIRYNEQYGACYDAYISGAHSRDEEIEKIKEGKCSLRRSLHRRISALVKEIDGLEDELKKLRNPWISVDDKMPEEGKKVLLYSPALEMGIGWLVGSMSRFNTFYLDGYGLFDEVTHWMPIPELKKGE